MSKETIRLEVIEKPLSAREAMMLAEYEHTIVKDFAAFYRVGQALAEINRLRLYRNEEGRTFERYCKELWDMSKTSAYQLIDASGVYGHLQLQCENQMSANCGHLEEGSPERKLPLNEAQVRPLTKFKSHPEKITAIWKEASASAPNGKVTASHVNKTVKEYLGIEIVKAVHRAQKTISQAASAEFVAMFEQFSLQILTERSNNYKYTSRGEIIKALDQLRADLAEDGDLIEGPAFHGGADDTLKLLRAGYRLFRTDRSSMTVKEHGGTGWKKHSGPFETIKAMDEDLKTILQEEKHLRG